KRFDALAARLADAERHRQDAIERQRKLDEEPITLPPDIGETPGTTATADDTHVPGGELHDVPPKEEPEVKDQAEFPDPELPKPPVVEQPTAISLNEE